MNRSSALCVFLIIAGAPLGLASCSGADESGAAPATTTVLPLPEGGIQARALADSGGNTHAVYFSGDPKAGDLYHAVLGKDRSWTAAKRINHRSNAAVAQGAIRGANIALGADDRIHVIWNGLTAVSGGGIERLPLLYTRSSPGAGEFEPERNLIEDAWGLDGGGAVAADAKGAVYAVWHAGPMGGIDAQRHVHLRVSHDHGETFDGELTVDAANAGACGCCGLAAGTDASGSLYIAYRTARENVHRDATLLMSDDGGRSFTPILLGEWEVTSCPVSNFALQRSSRGMLVAWEAMGRAFFAEVTSGTHELGPIVRATGTSPSQKYPVAIETSPDTRVLTWSEGARWGEAGRPMWQRYTTPGTPLGPAEAGARLPVWDFATPVALASGGFAIVY